jgi:2-desacetyl-2-hydroxyethyl bacteriochlorophyllide A dehydrogenase
MKSTQVVMTGPRTIGLEDIDLNSDNLGDHEVVLRTHFSLISPGTELAYWEGEQDLGHRILPYPFHPGYAAVGEVLEAGSKAGVQSGQSVLAHTQHQSTTRFDARRTVCLPLPERIDPALAPFGRLGQVSAVSIHLMQARPGDTAAVVGLGLVGNCAAQLLRCAGLRVIGIDTNQERRTLAEQCGITVPADEAVAAHGDTCSAVLECSGAAGGVLAALSLARSHGEVFLVGAAWKRDPSVIAADLVRPVFNKYLALRSGWEWQIPLYGDGPEGSIARSSAWVLNCIQDGTFRARELITDIIRPQEIEAAYNGLLTEPSKHMGVIIQWEGST